MLNRKESVSFARLHVFTPPVEEDVGGMTWSQSGGAAVFGTPNEYAQMPADGTAHATPSDASSRLKYVDSPGPGPDTRVHAFPASNDTLRGFPAHAVGMRPVRDGGGEKTLTVADPSPAHASSEVE